MIDSLMIKSLYALSMLAVVSSASLLVDSKPRLSRSLRVLGFLGIPVLFLGTGLLKLLDYQLLLTLTASVIAVGVSLHGEGYYKVMYGLAKNFQLVVDLVLASLILLFSSTLFIELIMYWFFVDVIIAFIALTMEYGTENLKVAAIYIAMCIAPSDIALLTMWAILASKIGLYESLLLPLNTPLSNPLSLDLVTSVVMLFGFAVKLGQFPLHSWLPIVHGKAPSHISAILSGLVIKIGVYAFFLSSQFFTLNPVAFYVLLVQGFISTIYGSFSAVLQTDVKRILACSSVGYGGVLTLLYAISMILELNTLHVVILAVIAFHALTKALAFVNAGLVYQLTNTYDVSKLGYVIYLSREAGISAFNVLLNVTGIPPSVGFIVKLLLIAVSLLVARVNPLGLVMVLAFVLAAIFSIIYGAKYMSTYISALPRPITRTVPIPRIEVQAETYLSATTLVAPLPLIAYVATVISQPIALTALFTYVITLVTYVYVLMSTYTRARFPEEAKCWLSGVES